MNYRLLTAILLILFVAFIYMAVPTPSNLWEIISSTDIESLAAYLRGYGPWAIAVSLLGNMLADISGLPTVFFSGANGLIFGFWGGVAVSWVAEILGGTIAFLLFRATLYKKSKRYIQKYKNLQFLDRLTAAEGFRAILIARLIPLSPSGLINIAAAMSPMSFRNFFLATALGKLPSIMAEVYIGRDLLSFQDNKIRVAFWLVLAIGIYLYSRMRRKKNINSL
ncbi:MAG: TVP38/TMEM64 family protein [Sporomusaceae bacterium]|nr:TVP38/TMEM64 family protein [Sporomusaceae bacterium]